MVQSKKSVKPTSSAVKEPDQWKTGNEPMTGAQASYLHTLADQAHDPAAASVDALREEVGLSDD